MRQILENKENEGFCLVVLDSCILRVILGGGFFLQGVLGNLLSLGHRIVDVDLSSPLRPSVNFSLYLSFVNVLTMNVFNFVGEVDQKALYSLALTCIEIRLLLAFIFVGFWMVAITYLQFMYLWS
ncbi:hypothetical protein KFK09_025969 [Dendrobium nobile]|uniref:Uncharacterized protein n=1 Tax=Dendrobium nobile TaxID=94219 RepID=A0A8T3A6L3_DENNO|nr:hypothetical protein KFK09_025969 [Dendrobium nobile]